MADESSAAVYVRIQGRVQGVGFRFFAQREAESFGVTGWVRNCPNGDVESEAEGPRGALLQWIERLHQGPNLSRVEKVTVQWHPAAKTFTSFNIQG